MSQKNEYEERYKKDLEKAQALSLESLALEKFRLQKLVDDRKRETVKKIITPNEIPRSRPRPGGLSIDNRVPLIKPPPIMVRRNSNTVQSVSSSDTNSLEDLVSFDSPALPSRASNNIIIESSLNSERTDYNIINSAVHTSLPSMTERFGTYYMSNIQPSINGSNYTYQPTLTFHPSYQAFSSREPVRNVSENRLNNAEFSVLNAIKKKEDNNLIDLTLFKGVTNSSSISYEESIEWNLKIDHKKTTDVENRNFETESCDGEQECTRVRQSVLVAFDPFYKPCDNFQTDAANDNQEEKEEEEEDNSECSNSLYAMYDPFDYMYSPSECSQHSDPIYAAVTKNRAPVNVPPPLPPRNRSTTNNSSAHNSTCKNYHNGNTVIKKERVSTDPDLLAFLAMVKNLRSKFIHSDPETNAGIVISPRIDNNNFKNANVLVTLYHNDTDENSPTFSCDACSTVEDVITHGTREFNIISNPNDYMLKVRGLSEYFLPHTRLSCYLYVHQCIKLDVNVELCLLPISQISRNLARTAQDDEFSAKMELEDMFSYNYSQLVSYESLNIVLETLEKEMKKIEKKIADVVSTNSSNAVIQTRGVSQALKAICSLMGNIEPLDLSKNLSNFTDACCKFSGTGSSKPHIINDDGQYSIVNVQKFPTENEVLSYCEKIRSSVYKMIETYCKTFNVDFQMGSPTYEFTGVKYSSQFLDPILVYIDGLDGLANTWNYSEYLVAAQIYHGTRPVGQTVLSNIVQPSTSFYKRLTFDFWLNFEGTNICLLPRESRLVFVLYGRSINSQVDQNSMNSGDTSVQTEIGWTSVQFYDYDNILSQGSFMLLLWPPCADKRLGPSPPLGFHCSTQSQPILSIEFPCYSSHIKFPFVEKTQPVASDLYDFNSLDQNTQEQLLQIIEQDTFSRPPAEDREVLWEKRHYLLSKPHALPKILLAAHSWDYACLSDLHSMLHSCSPLPAVDALQLLLSCFPDCEVRKTAVLWMETFTHDEVVDYLPQLVQALKHETFETSDLAKFLLERALLSPRVAHYLFWLLTHFLTTAGHQHSNYFDTSNPADKKDVSNARYFRRIQFVLRVLECVCGQAMKDRFSSQQLLVKALNDVAENVKNTKESLRLKILLQDLESVNDMLQESATCLPLTPSLEVNGIEVKTCSYYPSNTLPLKINFRTPEKTVAPAIFKAGDDLQQDVLTIQMMRIMNQLWLKEGLDLRILTFTCMPTGEKRGLIEMIKEAETLRKIQIELGLTGSFKETPIAEWLMKHNPSASEYERAVENFTASCAGYSVATYILGICDRHNDNIMVDISGNMFHIDFGKFFGDAQTFGSFKRDRTPFVLTPDMMYVINGGDKSTERFHYFVDLCCQAFNIVRKRGNLLLNLFGLMISSGIPGVTMEAVHYVQKALLLELSNAEAAATFARMIESSLKSRFTQFNFFLHNLAQLRFTGDHNDSELLSFVPKRYTISQEGRILGVEVFGYQKRYDPEKYYVYILKVKRENQPDPTYLFRSYKEFVEFQQKLCILFPLAKCYSLQSSNLLVGRSNIKQVAERRKYQIQEFLRLLFGMADEISHSDVVYTFFHPLLRDQQDSNIHSGKLKERKLKSNHHSNRCLRGQLKLSVQYQRDAFVVMVHHAKELPVTANNQEPSTYVKVYLLPDPARVTKRKTKVIKRNCHPSFMEMLEYRMPLEIIKNRVLQATIWNHDTLQENEFLGGISIPLQHLDLSVENIEWYALSNIYR